ncbi:MAG: hypothetical protein AAGC86_15680 [Pseudomonadota bacterium]
MTLVYSEEEIIAAVPGLDRTLLVRFVETRIVIPLQRPSPPRVVYSQIDAARLRLACELRESLDVNDDALSVILDLVDRLHGTRGDLRAVLEAVETLPETHRRAVTGALGRRLDSETE